MLKLESSMNRVYLIPYYSEDLRIVNERGLMKRTAVPTVKSHPQNDDVSL